MSNETARPDLTVLAELARTVAARRGDDPAVSYTAKLLDRGTAQCAKKLGEEAVELALASVSGDRAHTAAEAADVLYHLTVLLESAAVPFDDVMAELARRKGVSGIAEKAARKA